MKPMETNDEGLIIAGIIVAVVMMLILRWIFQPKSDEDSGAVKTATASGFRAWLKGRVWSPTDRSVLMSGYWRLMLQLTFFTMLHLVLLTCQFQFGWQVPEWALSLCRTGFIFAAGLSLVSAVIGKPPSVILAVVGVVFVTMFMWWSWQHSEAWLMTALVS